MMEKIDQTMLAFYEQADLSPDLVKAITYSIKAGGKRIRPLLCLQVLAGFGLDLTASHYQVAVSVELIHTGSLIHDDLPAMDDDDFRRGLPTNHKQFGEALAILAGDGLFLDPFALLAEADLPEAIRLRLISELSRAAGSFGMVAGQALDMAGEGQSLALADLQAIHANKTGKLLTFPFVAAGLMAGQSQPVLEQLRQAGQLVGLAFQVRDDILDVTADFADLGKTPQKDLLAEKSTYPSLLGLDKSYEILDSSLDQAQAIFADLALTQGFEQTAIQETIERLRLHA
ncbi:polyprenyl synthetase family protein [Streptococcus cuniculipharyngis]|uniref:Farnesyl diphosphate synthase n=2 Tax=Streptococcus cuniculipharyngis TaxID=1562651 RepID=A0A5C5SE54_9STRE|nr:farnesyl diphosphate synthase [Streptococcus cuniculipharyngis]TWS99266.1 polyprenyl synthetase family protein [Streptococcus cuniculipharyngis]